MRPANLAAIIFAAATFLSTSVARTNPNVPFLELDARYKIIRMGEKRPDLTAGNRGSGRTGISPDRRGTRAQTNLNENSTIPPRVPGHRFGSGESTVTQTLGCQSRQAEEGNAT
jgi:hypothetical protein